MMELKKEMERIAEDIREALEALERVVQGNADSNDERTVREWLDVHDCNADLFEAFLDQLLDIEVHEAYSFATRNRYPHEVHLVHGVGGPNVRTIVNTNGEGVVRVAWGTDVVELPICISEITDYILTMQGDM